MMQLRCASAQLAGAVARLAPRIRPAHHTFASALSRSYGSRSQRPRRGDGSSMRRVEAREDFREMAEYDDDDTGGDSLSAQDEALWQQISQSDRRPTQMRAPAVRQQQEVELTFDGSRDNDAPQSTESNDSYTAYRPYSDPRSANVDAADSSSASGPPKPRYSSSRQTPAQLAWKAGGGNNFAENGQRGMNESRDAAARSRYAARHGLGRAAASESAASEPQQEDAWPTPNRDSFPRESGRGRDPSSRGFQGFRPSARSSEDVPDAAEFESADRGADDFGSRYGSDSSFRGGGGGGGSFGSKFSTRRSEEGFRERVGVERGGRGANWGRGGRDSRGEPESDYWRDRPSRFGRDFDSRGGGNEWREGNFDRRGDRERGSFRGSLRSDDSFGGRGGGRRDRGGDRDFDRSYERESFRSSSGRVGPARGELLYGFHPVVSALIAQKRESLHHLYLQENKAARVDSQSSDSATASSADPQLRQVLDLAQRHQVPISYIPRHDLNLAADNRPHNGFILDASALSPPLIHGPRDLDAYLTSEQGGETWLLLDEVMDPQNLGAMMRSAWYFGVDGVLLCAKNSAPLSPVTSKASSGAQEALRLLAVGSTPRLLHKLRETEWNIVGLSLAPNSIDLRQLSSTLQQRDEKTAADAAEAGEPAPTKAKHTLLVVGNEGAGLRQTVAESCHILAKIAGGGADSAQFATPKRNEQGDATTTSTADDAPPVASTPAAAAPIAHVFVDSLNVSNALAVALYELTGRSK